MVLTRTHIPSVPKHQTAAKNMTQVYLLLSCSYSHPPKMSLGWRIAFSFDIPKQDKVSKIKSSNNSSSKSKTAKCLKKFYLPLSSYFAISSKKQIDFSFSRSLSLSLSLGLIFIILHCIPFLSFSFFVWLNYGFTHFCLSNEDVKNVAISSGYHANGFY